jgi:hypothetical protein
MLMLSIVNGLISGKLTIELNIFSSLLITVCPHVANTDAYIIHSTSHNGPDQADVCVELRNDGYIRLMMTTTQLLVLHGSENIETIVFEAKFS